MNLNSYTNPSTHLFWLASRSLGVAAIILLAASITTGLFLSSRFVKQPGAPSYIRIVHEALALTAVAMILAHGLLLVGDQYLHVRVIGVFIPFMIKYRTFWTGVGVIGGWLTAIFTFSFYVRKTIGIKRWRFIHRFTLLAYILGVVHVVGSGTDGKSWWMLVLLVVISAPIVFLATFRYLPKQAKAAVSKKPA